MDGNEVHDFPTPIVNLTQLRECAQLISSFLTGHFLEITIVDVMNMYIFTNKLNRKSNSNI
jgi:hypothetical protein